MAAAVALIAVVVDSQNAEHLIVVVDTVQQRNLFPCLQSLHELGVERGTNPGT